MKMNVILIECFPELNICSPDSILLLQPQHVCNNEEYNCTCAYPECVLKQAIYLF